VLLVGTCLFKFTVLYFLIVHGADKYLAQARMKQATAKEDIEFHKTYL
jgi:hypothetical protein